METLATVMNQLKKLGSEQTRKTFARHGAPAEFYGVSVGNLKTIAKKIKGQQKLALELYSTGVSDAMYLAGLVADGGKMTKKQLESWAKDATWYMISGYTVPWVASECPDGWDLALKWIDSKQEKIATSGWATLSSWLSVKPDSELDLPKIKSLLQRVVREIDSAPNRVRYDMNGFVIAVGAYVRPLLADAKSTAKKIGEVQCDMGDTACRVPVATEYIKKIESKGRVGKKRMTAKC